MSFAANYLRRQSYLKKELISVFPDRDTEIIVIIPSYKEERILETLGSIYNCYLPSTRVEVLVLFNYPEDKKDLAQLHLQQYQKVVQWATMHNSSLLAFYPICMALPSKDAGVGLARKILMDEAIVRFNKINQPEGIIVSLDADCSVDKNYLIALTDYFRNNPKILTTSIYFEHPIEGNNFDDNIYSSIIIYELYLRYYVEALRYAHYPFAFHTIGSAFAVRAEAYIKQGGMNKRKAGEDFYFLNKMMLLGGYGEINTTMVIPSPRISDRVPFGTGAAIKKILNGKNEYLNSWSLDVFMIIKDFITSLPDIYNNPNKNNYHPVLKEFLNNINWKHIVAQSLQHSTNEKSFIKRIFYHIDGLKILQFIHFAHQKEFKKNNLVTSSRRLLEMQGIKTNSDHPTDILYKYREKQRSKEVCFFW